MATTLADGTWAALWLTLGLKAGEFAARQQAPQAPKVAPPGVCFKWYARPLGARVHAATIPAVPAVTATVVAGAGPGAGPARVPGGWVLCTGGPDPVHGFRHQPHVRRPWAAPLPLRAVQQYALVIPPLPRWSTASSAAAAGPLAGPPAPAALLLGGGGGCPPPALVVVGGSNPGSSVRPGARWRGPRHRPLQHPAPPPVPPVRRVACLLIVLSVSWWSLSLPLSGCIA